MNEQVMLDANLLVYAFYPKAPQYRPADWVLTQAQGAHAGLCVSSQVLAEFYAVVTNPKHVNPALKRPAAPQRILEVQSLPGLTLLLLPVDVVVITQEGIDSFIAVCLYTPTLYTSIES